MHEDGYKTRQVLLKQFHVFVRVFGLDTNHTFFPEHNLSIKLCATNLQTHAKRKQKIVQGHGLSSMPPLSIRKSLRTWLYCDNIVLAFDGFKVS